MSCAINTWGYESIRSIEVPLPKKSKDKEILHVKNILLHNNHLLYYRYIFHFLLECALSNMFVIMKNYLQCEHQQLQLNVDALAISITFLSKERQMLLLLVHITKRHKTTVTCSQCSVHLCVDNRVPDDIRSCFELQYHTI